ncbi:MAG TPA: NAD-dependent epimerase/dehydratase family protein [Longimicrobiaceae bacterium]|nr:NAD-dependent epimerase/dehydratase family protein [Longimicrobiaceae bacterium]
MYGRELDRSARCFVTGGMGFIGSHLVDRLWEHGCTITVYDTAAVKANRWWGDYRKGRLEFVQGDLRDSERLSQALAGHEVVFHLAAFTDTRASGTQRTADLEQGTVATWHLLEAMQQQGVRDLVFTSSQLVYGDQQEMPLREYATPLLPVSLYGASKVACEALIRAYSHLFGLRSVILRLSNIVGGRMKRGILRDFIHRLLENPERLEILGDGEQARNYLLVDHAVDAFLCAHAGAPGEGCHVYNVGNLDTVRATEIARIVVEEMGLVGVTEIAAAGGRVGWAGDVPSLLSDLSRIRALGWSPGLNSAGCIRESVRRLQCDLAGAFMLRETTPLVQLGNLPVVRG